MSGDGMNASVRYSRDRPKSCEFCYYWKGRPAGCSLGEQNCFYIIHDEKNIREKDNLFATAFHICKNAADADDVVQDTFLQYHLSEKCFEDEQHIRAWLLRVAIKDNGSTIYFDIKSNGSGGYSLTSSDLPEGFADAYTIVD